MGVLKRKKKNFPSKFRKGHTFFTPGSRNNIVNDADECQQRKWLPRFTQRDYSLAVKDAGRGKMFLPDADGRCTGHGLLRPKSDAEPDISTQYLDGAGGGEMRLIHKEKNVLMFNTCIAEHAEFAQCITPTFTVHKEEKWGLCWRQSLRCTNCDYLSKTFNLYEDVASERPGRPANMVHQILAYRLVSRSPP